MDVFNNARRKGFTNSWYGPLSLSLFILFSFLFSGPKFLHIYLTTPGEILEKIVPLADQNGYRAIVITCDHPTDRVRDAVLPLFEEASKNIDPELQKSMPMPNMNLPDIIVKQNLSTGAITWANVEWIKNLSKLPIICKGILSPLDAELAIKYGANGIIVRFVFHTLK